MDLENSISDDPLPKNFNCLITLNHNSNGIFRLGYFIFYDK